MLCSFLGFLTIISFRINKEFQSSAFINKYLLIVFVISSVRFLIYGLQPYFLDSKLKFLLNNAGEIAYVFIVPFLFLYFQALLFGKKWHKREILHLIVPVIIVLLNYCRFILANESQALTLKKMMFVIYVPYALTYAMITFLMVKKQMVDRKSDIEIIEKQNLLIKKWSWILMSLFLLMAIKATIFILLKGFDYNNNDNSDLLWSGAIHWIVIYMCFLYNPDIIYGYNAINKKIETHLKNQNAFGDMWIVEINKESITNSKDIKLFEKISFELQHYLNKIEDVSFNSHLFRNPETSLEDFSNAIKIPSSHLMYVFKYHSSVSFNDYKKIVRIQDAIKLLKSDYLKTNTIEALSMEVGFSSYSPFFSSFKNITGMAPLDYYKSIS